MLCSVCKEDIFQGDDIKCSKCNLHFSCGGMRETNLRKLAKANNEKWCCAKYKSMIINTSITQEENSFVGSNETLANLTESVKFMSNQFDNFGKQLSEVLNSIKELKEENKSLKETNCKLKVDIGSLTKKVNVLEQNAIISNVEIIRMPVPKK
jgi:activator of 2-hydroxyglutaryl-CoA dehydratase